MEYVPIRDYGTKSRFIRRWSKCVVNGSFANMEIRLDRRIAAHAISCPNIDVWMFNLTDVGRTGEKERATSLDEWWWKTTEACCLLCTLSGSRHDPIDSLTLFEYVWACESDTQISIQRRKQAKCVRLIRDVELPEFWLTSCRPREKKSTARNTNRLWSLIRSGTSNIFVHYHMFCILLCDEGVKIWPESFFFLLNSLSTLAIFDRKCLENFQ